VTEKITEHCRVLILHTIWCIIMLIAAIIPHTGREIQKQGSKSDDE